MTRRARREKSAPEGLSTAADAEAPAEDWGLFPDIPAPEALLMFGAGAGFMCGPTNHGQPVPPTRNH